MSIKSSPETAKAARRAARARPRAIPAKPTFNVNESPLSWLRRRKDKDGRPLIGAAEYEAGERLRADFTFAQLMPSLTTRLVPGAGSGARSAPGAGVELQYNVLAARERVRIALAVVGPELAGILIDVCCHLKGIEAAESEQGWPLRSAKVVLQLALQRLARHYGLLAVVPDRGNGLARVRHWGSEGYRPGLSSPPPAE